MSRLENSYYNIATTVEKVLIEHICLTVFLGWFSLFLSQHSCIFVLF